MLPQGHVHLSPGFQLIWEDARQSYILMHAGGIIPLQAGQEDILKRCNGSLSVAEIIEDMQRQQSDVNPDEVREFLKVAYANDWIHGQ
jgi:pyrroloquinoline quinone biosynthesis protein D